MFIYLLELIAIFYLAQKGPYTRKSTKVFLGILMLFAALVCGLGDMLGGYDRYIYGEIFDATADDRALGINIFLTSAFNYAENEKGYAFYNYFLTYITSNRYIFILLTTLLMYVAVYRHTRWRN